MLKQSQVARMLALATAFSLVLVFFSSTAVAASPSSATFTVTAVAKKGGGEPPAVTKADALLMVSKQRTPVSNWQRGEKLELAVLIDESLEVTVASQWNELKAFFQEQPDTTYIAVAYARNGTAVVAQDFTNDHQLAAKALRIPIGGVAAFSSPYLALQDWMKRWPATNNRHSILLISSGFDDFRGGGFGPRSPDLDTTIEHAQKQNINVWSIYFPDGGHRGRSFRGWTGQLNLSDLAEETGGESFYLGFEAPVSFKPYLDELAIHLRNQYLLSFEGDGGAKGKLESVRVSTELSGVEFFSATRAFLSPGM